MATFENRAFCEDTWGIWSPLKRGHHRTYDVERASAVAATLVDIQRQIVPKLLILVYF